MSTGDSQKPVKNRSLLSVDSAAGLVRSLFGRRPDAVQEQRFNEFVDVLEQHEQGEAARHEEEIRALYEAWAKQFELLKREFNDLVDLFSSLERRLSGWFSVSPNLARWGSIACGRGGYTFAACIMKNHDRDAPLSEKSLSVSFGLEALPPGIGDERWLGWQGDPSDTLAGLSGCAPTNPRAQARAARALLERVNGCELMFRLNHHTIGQQACLLPLSILERYALRDLCQGLFVMLNNDVLSDLRATLAYPEELLLPDVSFDKAANADQ